MHVLCKRLALLEFNLIYISFARRCRREWRGESAVPDQLHGARGEHWLGQLFMHVTINWAAWLPFDCDSFELARSTLVSHGRGRGRPAASCPPYCTASRRSFRQLPHLSRLQRLLPHTGWLWPWLRLWLLPALVLRLDATRCGLAWLVWLAFLMGNQFNGNYNIRLLFKLKSKHTGGTCRPPPSSQALSLSPISATWHCLTFRTPIRG